MKKIKISGLTNYKDSLDATNLGANFLSFDFFKESQKKVSEKLFLDITSKLPSFISSVAVFLDVEEKYLVKTIKKYSIKNVQFNADVSLEFCKYLKESQDIKIFKYFDINQESDISKIYSYRDVIDYLILNISCQNLQACRSNCDTNLKIIDLKVPVFINVTTEFEDIKKIIKNVNPYGFDTDLLIERLPTRKDYNKMNAFVKASRCF